MLVVAAVAALGWFAGRWVTPAPSGPSAHSAGSAAGQPAPAGGGMDGEDPAQAGCVTGAVTEETRPLLVGSVGQLGAVRLWYSPRCAGGWAQFVAEPRLDAHAGYHVTVSVHRSGDDTGSSFKYRFDGRPVYSDLLLAGPGCLQASATITGPASAGEPSVTASTDCHADFSAHAATS